MATASRRRRSRTAATRVPTKKANALQSLTSRPNTTGQRQHQHQYRHRLHPDDPRLKLSMRAFHPVLDKSKRRPSRVSFSSSQSSHSSQSPTIAPSTAATPTAYMAFASSTAACADLYDPRSPWGVTGIKYDPCSPWTRSNAPHVQFSLTDAATSASDSASPHSSPSPPPPPACHELPFHRASGLDTQVANETANHGLACDIADMFATRRQNADKAKPEASDMAKPNYLKMRFVVAEMPASGPEASAAAGSGPSKVLKDLPLARPAKATAKKAQPAKKTPVPAPASLCRCPPQVPSTVRLHIDSNTRDYKKIPPTMGMFQQQVSSILHLLCATHREKYQRMETASTPGFSVFSARPPTAALPIVHHTPLRPPPTPLKSLAFSLTPSATPTAPTAPTAFTASTASTAARPSPKVVRDDIYRHEMLREIANRFSALETSEEYTHGDVANRVVYDLLNVAVHPQPIVNGQGDAHFVSGDEAYELLDQCAPRAPVVTQNEQTFRWRPRMRPIEELFRRMENLDRKVSVQVPSRRCTDSSFESRDLAEVRGRFLNQSAANADPWNILDLRSPLPAAVLPQFLTSENCQLLPRLRDEVLNPGRAERDSATREQWNEWRDVLEWVLLSEGGHNTSPHTDSHGLATWITVQEGLFGFGWMSDPTPAERQQWMDDPQGFRGGRWCFMVLEPGQTVFFNSGTVHFVFRQHGQATLALGGHILQWSGIARWLEIVGAQMKNPHITNEDMEWSAPRYVRVVARLVAMRLQQGKGKDVHSEHDEHDEVGRIKAMGGEASVEQLLVQLKDFDDEYLRPRPKARSKKKRR